MIILNPLLNIGLNNYSGFTMQVTSRWQQGYRSAVFIMCPQIILSPSPSTIIFLGFTNIDCVIKICGNDLKIRIIGI